MFVTRLTCRGDQRRSATAAALGHVLATLLVASVSSPHIAASPPITNARSAAVPCADACCSAPLAGHQTWLLRGLMAQPGFRTRPSCKGQM